MRFDSNMVRMASLDIHSPLYLRTEESKFGGGGIDELYDLVEKAAEARFKLIEMTPIQDTGLNPCPYVGISLFSYNPIFLSVERVAKNAKIEKLIEEQVRTTPSKISLINYEKLYRFKEAILRAAFEESADSISFKDFGENQLAYAVFKVLSKKFKRDWVDWPREFKTGNVAKIIKKQSELHHEIKFVLFCQKILENQWLELVNFARERDIAFIMDKPIYPSVNSADVWANQELFYLKNDGQPRFVSGVNIPGDPFGEQIWGHAVYQFKEKPDKVIKFFDRTIAFLAKTSEVIRLDHALAYVWSYYLYDPDKKSGHYVNGLRDKLFNHINQKFPEIFFIAEDVGFVDEKLVDLPLQKHGLPGIRCLQWGSARYVDFAKYPGLCMAITANHDTDSLLAWWKKMAPEGKQEFYRIFGGEGIDDDEAILHLIELVFESPAFISSVTLRDIVGDERRFNLPGSNCPENWRLSSPLNLEDTDFSLIKEIIIDTKRAV